MTRWAKNTKEFNVSLSKSTNADGSKSLICRVPKPIVDFLGDPDKLKFIIKRKYIVVSEGDNK